MNPARPLLARDGSEVLIEGCSIGEELPEYVFENLRVYPGARPDLVERLPPGLGRVLDVGCGAGALGEALLLAGKATSVSGVDISPEAIRQAGNRLEEAHVVDLDQATAPFPTGSFDTILYADVLEHLKFPWAVVRSQRSLLRGGGRVFCSLPNVGHYKVLLRLLRQRWEYEIEGVLDYTHLRFFTRHSLRAMFLAGGYRVAMASPLYASSLKVRAFNALTLGRIRDIIVFAWWLEART